MTFGKEEKDISEKLLEYEEKDLLEYCKKMGYSEKQTNLFIKNSLSSISMTGVNIE